MTVAVVPLRGGGAGKSRLAPLLDERERVELVARLARHVVGTVADAEGITRLIVVTRDVAFARETLAEHGQGAAVEIVEQPATTPGLDAATDLGRRLAHPEPVLLVHADLPALTAADVEALLAHDADVVLATDRHGTGTNALLLREARFQTAFGIGSRTAHEAEAARLGLRSIVVDRSGLALDLDTPADAAELSRPAAPANPAP